MSKQDNYKIEITINSVKDDEMSFEMSLDEAVKKIKEGYLSGSDGNEDEEYSFGVNKNK